MSKPTSLIGSALAEIVSPEFPPKKSSHLCLEVSRGQTRFPCRPVSNDRFLIGADTACDLRLDGKSMPALHSIIYCEDGEIWLDSFVESPVLKVNGEVERSVQIADGDRIEIGSFQFVARQSQVPVDHSPPRDESATGPAIPAVDGRHEAAVGRPLAELTASELVELIEQEQSLVARMEGRRQLGAGALLHAVQQKAGGKATETAAGHVELEFLRDLERVLKGLNEVAQELQQRSDRLRRREASYADAAELLLDAQHKVGTQLESLLGQLPADEMEPVRAIA